MHEPAFQYPLKLLSPQSIRFHDRIMNIIERKRRESTCIERQVCAAIVGIFGDSLELLSIANNGVPREFHDLNESIYHNMYCIHAEDRALKHVPSSATKYKISYCNLSPCYQCADLLSSLPIIAHIYRFNYNDPTGIECLLKKGIPVYQYNNGKLIPVHPDISLEKREVFISLMKSIRRINKI